jgi:hypothetical protein
MLDLLRACLFRAQRDRRPQRQRRLVHYLNRTCLPRNPGTVS